MSTRTALRQHRRRLIAGGLLAVLAIAGLIVALRVARQDGGSAAEPAATSAPTVETVPTTVPATPPAAPEELPLPAPLRDFFPIGVDFQPVENFERWKERGINTLIRAPEGVDVNDWADAADAAGLYQVRPPREPAAADIGNPLLLAWSHPDEPDFNPRQIPAPAIQAQYDAWKQVDPTRPILVNINGSMDSTDLETGEGGDEFYRPYVAAADWISGDIYPVNRNEPLTWVGEMVDRIEPLAEGRPVFAYIESSDYDTDDVNSTVRSGSPTPDELRGEVWHAIIHGARGIWYFPERIRPTFSFDNTPDDLAAAMPALHATITSLASVLQGPIDPPGISATVAAPLEVGWRDAPSGSYFVVLNMSDKARDDERITLDGVGSATSAQVYDEGRSVEISNGTITDDFGPYAVHIYHVP